MAIIRRLVAHDEQYDNQWLKVDHNSKYIVNECSEWQFLFGPNSELNLSSLTVKLAARFNDSTFNNIQLSGYLYDSNKATSASAASCMFKVYKITTPDWTEVHVLDATGTLLTNGYFYSNQLLPAFGVDFQGGDTLMIEATLVRLGVTYRDRIYVNHLGIYDNVTRLRQDVEFLEITKKDL
jgi:hypothetical protein